MVGNNPVPAVSSHTVVKSLDINNNTCILKQETTHSLEWQYRGCRRLVGSAGFGMTVFCDEGSSQGSRPDTASYLAALCGGGVAPKPRH